MRLFRLSLILSLSVSLSACGGCTDPPALGSNNGDGDSGVGGDLAPGRDAGNGADTSVEPDTGFEQDQGLTCPQRPVCATAEGNVCCGAEEGCVFEKCVELGPACDEQTACPFTHFCEPTLGRCIDLGEDPNACLFVPPVGEFTPVEAYKWESSLVDPTYDQVMMMPVVGNLTDDNGDAVIDTQDVPDIVFVTFAGGAYNSPGVLRVISGDDGREHWSSTGLPVPFDVHGSAVPAIGDVDGDGVVEIIVEGGTSGGIYAIEHDGIIKWHQPAGVGTRYGGPSIANLDGAGGPEIVAAGQVLNAVGDIVCSMGSTSVTPAVADLDGDGQQEILMGRGFYELTNAAATDGTGCTAVADGPEAYPAVADFDGDGQPEIAYAQNGALVLTDHTGKELWNVTLPLDPPRISAEFGVADCSAAPAGMACGSAADCGAGICAGGTCYVHKGCHPGGGPPTIADFDGDRQPEIGIAARWYYLVFESDGSILWAHKTHDFSSAVTGSSVFDFEGDGRAEVVYNDEQYLRVYRGSGTGVDGDGDGFADAEILLEVQNSSGTLAEYPLIVDVDNDDNAEIIVAANNYGGQVTSTGDPSPTHGIRVFKDAENRWVGTRPIWNQHTYHVTNVEEDGTIPVNETDSWSVSWLNNYRQNVQGGNPFTAPNLTVSVDAVDALSCTTGGVRIDFTLRNQGSLGVRAGQLDATIYAGPSGQPLPPIVTVQNTTPLPPGASEALSYVWSPPAALAGQRFDVKIVVDDDGMGMGQHNECVEDDNEGRLVDTLCVVPQ